MCPSFPYREGHPKENCIFHPQSQAEEQAVGLTCTSAPWTLVPGCCTLSSNPTSLGLHLLSPHCAVPTTYCVSLPFQLPLPARVPAEPVLHRVRGMGAVVAPSCKLGHKPEILVLAQ